MYENLWRELREHLKRTNRPIPFPPVTESDVQETENALGFQIPALLKELYLQIGDGGFGPGTYGILRMKGGGESSVGTLVETYNQVREAAEYLELPWPIENLPFCEWGCNILSVVECKDPYRTIYLSETCKLRRVGYTLEDFVKMWIGGVSILDQDDAPRETKEITNPFTGKKFTVKGGPKKK